MTTETNRRVQDYKNRNPNLSTTERTTLDTAVTTALKGYTDTVTKSQTEAQTQLTNLNPITAMQTCQTTATNALGAQYPSATQLLSMPDTICTAFTARLTALEGVINTATTAIRT